MSYKKEFGFGVEPINYLSHDIYSLEQFQNFLYDNYKENFLKLFQFIVGIKVVYEENEIIIDRDLNDRDYYPFNCDLLKPKTIRAAIETLNDPELNDLLFECHLTKQSEAIRMAELIHSKIMVMLGHPDPKPKPSTATEARPYAPINVQGMPHES